MPCFRCSTRQTDPARGSSPWFRGVVAGEQVLVCPPCQAAGVATELDQCAACGSRRLAKSLGEVMCRECGRQGVGVTGVVAGADAEPPAGTAVGSVTGPGAGGVAHRRRVPGLSEEIEAAIQRLLDRGMSGP